ncbi:DUF998 domain-containing protein [Nocardioides sp.]|uniref:DUF998 domain-containing protein n=1 Tax=Nocardioides sp. TaxID=35761 RepID=UPI0027336FB7|nr:DUF998 domain-containing protein [Nocardioides sp.]MDP3893974.1 DUF998 domain-containing protein [Nocardioides sp.]
MSGLLIGCLVASALALGLAPLLMPAGYDWLTHTTSESAAQGVPGAWLARLGFVLLGLAVLGLAVRSVAWGRVGRLLHGVFAVSLFGTAVFSSRPFDPAAAFDATEDLLHSVTATAMGFAFAFGVVAVALSQRSRPGRLRALDALAVLASVVLPLGMLALPDLAGVLQRVMFLVAYAWFGIEAWRLSGRRADG